MILLMFAMISILLNLIPCLVSVECLATANHWFPNLVSLMCSEIPVEHRSRSRSRGSTTPDTKCWHVQDPLVLWRGMCSLNWSHLCKNFWTHQGH